MALFVNEIFFSIQGESLYAGCPCAFVRLSGCNLRCRYCDTTYAYEAGRSMRIAEVLEQIRQLRCPLIEITGGEPLLQADTPALIRELLEQNYTVLLETNGSLDIRKVPSLCIKIMDIKCPGSGESQNNRFSNLEHLQSHDQIKFVLTDRSDYEYAKTLLFKRVLPTPPVPVLFSPASGLMNPRMLAEWILADHLPVRLQLQLHKLIWPDLERGV